MSDRFRTLWAEWELTAACRFTTETAQETFRLLLRSKVIKPPAFTDRFGEFREEAYVQLRRAGASVAFGGWENLSNQALALSRTLEAELNLPVQINLYVTPGGNQGLGAHVDPHDVLVLQIQGEKNWDIYSQDPASGPDPIQITLKQGSWLYLPKGTRHEVQNRSPLESVHFTIGFHPLTWGEVFQRALDRARVAALELNERPPHPGATDTAPDLQRRLHSVLPFVDLQNAYANYHAAFPALAVPVPAAATQDRMWTDTLSEDSRLRWRDEAALTLTSERNPRVALDYRRFPITLRHAWSHAAAWMQEAKVFRVEAIPTEDRSTALLLAKFLMNLGVLSRVEED